MSPDKNAVSRVEAEMIQERLARDKRAEQYAIASFVLSCAMGAADLRRLTGVRYGEVRTTAMDEASESIAMRIKREFKKTFGGEMLPWERGGEGCE